jgi:tetratricopeptide (TPR) repeat protein
MEGALAQGQQQFAAGKYVDALRSYSEAIRLDASCARAWSNRSACLAKLEKFEDALDDADEALRADKTFFKAHGRRAAALQGLKRYVEAAEAFQTALMHDGTNEVYRSGLAEVTDLIRQGRGVVGQESKDKFYFDKSLKEGKETMIKGELHEAVRHFSRAIELWVAAGKGSAMGISERDGATLYCNRSAAFYRLQKIPASLEDAEASVVVDRTYPRAHLRMGMSLRSSQRLDDAKSALEACIRLDPENAMAKEEMASLLSEIAERDKTNAQRIREHQEKTEAITDARRGPSTSIGGGANVGADGGVGNVASAMRRQAGPAHSTTYVYCSYCNTYNHDRSECPALRQARKRARD